MAARRSPQKTFSELRQRTGAGMMDCKKALEETGGDIDKAVEYLRKKGIAKAEKRADRAASEGAIVALVSDDGKIGALVEVNCETDFVARNEDFGALAQAVATQVVGDASFDGVVTVAAGRRAHEAGVAQGRQQDRRRGGEGSVGQDRRERRACVAMRASRPTA